MKREPFVAIIIVSFNKKELVHNAIFTLKKNTAYKNYKIIVSDNGSEDGGVDMIKKEFPYVDVIENKSNLGFGLAHNRGMDYALKKYNPDYYVSLNNDTEIHQKKWLQYLVETAESDKRIGVVGCKWFFKDGLPQHYALKGETYYVDKGVVVRWSNAQKREVNRTQDVKFAGGAVFLVPKLVVDKIGILDKFIPYYGEEIDYWERMRKNGFRIVYDGRAEIIHLKAQTINARKDAKEWFIMKKHSIKVELLNYPLRKIPYWWMIHVGAVFMKKRGDQRMFNKDFMQRFFLLLWAFLVTIPELPEILHKRHHRDEKIWFLG